MKFQCTLESLVIYQLFCYCMFTMGNICMSFTFGKETSIINQNLPQSVLYLFWLVQALGLL